MDYPDFFFDGFDTYKDTEQMQEEWSFSHALSRYVLRTHANLNDKRCIRIIVSAANAENLLIRSIATARPYAIMGVRAYFSAVDAGSFNTPFVFKIDTASGTGVCVTLLNSAGNVSVRLGGTGSGSEIFAVAGYIISTAAYYEVEVYRHGTDGFVGLYRDGNLMGSFSGDTSAITADLTKASLRAANYSGTNYGYFRDFYFTGLTSWVTEGGNNLGPGQSVAIEPDADETAEFTPSAGSDNYAMVDDVPNDEDTTYNESSTDSHEDIFSHGGLTETGKVFAVGVEYAARRTEVGVMTVRPVLISGATRENGTGHIPSDDYRVRLGTAFLADPDDSAAWTPAKVDALTFGYENVA